VSQPPDPPPQYGPPGRAAPDQYPFGRPSYVPPPYGPPRPPPWGPVGSGPRRPSGTRRAGIALAVVGVVLLAVLGLGAVLAVGRNGAANLAGSLSSVASLASSAASAGTKAGPLRPYQPRSTITSIPPATVPPTGLGSDPEMNRLAVRCHDGDMQACDDLFANSQANSLYEAYGDTCAGRQAADRDVYCTTMFPGS
jgi:hypothetical protein